MNTKDYDQKKWECWAAFKKQSECEGGCLMADAFFRAFDRAYALGKQERESKSMQLSDVKQKIDVWMNSHTDEEVYEALKKYGAIEDSEDTVIQGWVARDYDGDVFLYQNEPDRNEIAWNGYMMHSLPIDSFPDLTWESEPEPVEIIIKRKKK